MAATRQRTAGISSPPAGRSRACLIVIAFNEADKIEATLRAVLAQNDERVLLDVIVVDDASTDGTASVVENMARAHANLTLVRHEVNSGRGQARHTGITAAEADWVGFVDADIVLPTNWLTAALTALETSAAVSGTAVPDGDVSFVASMVDLRPKVVPHAVSITGSNCLFRRDVFDVVAYDTNLRNGEDVKLAVDMEHAGLPTKRVPELLVEHRETKSFSESVRWLFESGVGASGQMIRDRHVRLPDIATLGVVVSTVCGLALACVAGTRRGRTGRVAASARLAGLAGLSWMAGPATVVAATAAHLSTKFELARSPRSALTAVVIQTPLMSAYFAGRVVGFAAFLVRLPRPRRFADSHRLEDAS